MLRLSLIFFIVAFIAAPFALVGEENGQALSAWLIIFEIAAAAFVVSLLCAIVRRAEDE